MDEKNNRASEYSSASSLRQERFSFDWTVLLATAVFVLCIIPTIISYSPYSFRWDDSDYLWRSIAVSKAFWSSNSHDMRLAMVSIRPPVMTFLGLPWGPLTSWDAIGKCFITLTAFTASFVACCLFLLLRVGLKPLYLVIAGICALAAIGPYPAGSDANLSATGFMADSLFAWIAFAAVLLIPYETTVRGSSTFGSIMRGVFWAAILLAGAMTKVSFFYFIALIVPAGFIIRMRYSGLRSALLALVSLAVCSLPVAIYYLRFGLMALKNGAAASFGHDAPFYYIPLSQFLSETVRESPGLLLSVIITVAGVVYLLLRHREAIWSVSVWPLAIMIVYGAIAFASSNREIRYAFPAIIAPPFLVGLLLSGKSAVASRRHAIGFALFVFSCLLLAGVPMLHRPNKQCIHLPEVVLTQAIGSNAKHIALGTDSSSLNDSLMRVAMALSPSGSKVEIESLGWRAELGMPIETDFRELDKSDLIVFQNSEALDPTFTNQRASQYEQYTRQRFGDAPIEAVDGIRIYAGVHQPSTSMNRPAPTMQSR